MHSSEGKNHWVRRWRYVMAPTSRPGIWRLKDGGYFVRVRVTDPRTGRRVQCARVLHGANITIRDAVRVRDQLRHEGHERVDGKIPSLPLWSEYAASLLEAKVAEGKLSSSKSRERWGDVLKRLIPAFGRLHVDELRTSDIVAWRDQVARWLRDGMPSTRKRDEGKGKIVKLSPVTANGWLSILKVICAAMTKHYELARDPSSASGLVVFADGKEYDLVALCQRCYETIKSFLEANGWSLPLMRLVPELGDFVI